MYTTDGPQVNNSAALRLNDRDALLLVDLQQDFLPGGALAIPEGDQVIAPLNRLLPLFSARDLPIVATRDWHPLNHCSFTPQGGPWPAHCVQHTHGAQWAPALALPTQALIISKGDDATQEAYSGFQGTGLADQLRTLGSQRLFIGGLATDYCVLQTVLDARSLGFEALVIEDAIRAVNAHPGDGIRALEQMLDKGAELISLQDLLDANA